MCYVSRQILQKYSAFSRYLSLISLILCIGPYTLTLNAQTADQGPTQLQVFTEVRDGSEIVIDEDGNSWVDSALSRLTEAVLDESQLQFTVTVVPWPRMMSNLQSRPNTLAYPVLRIPEREELFLWGGLLRPIDAYLFGLRSRADELPHSLEGARNFRIASMRGDAFHSYFSALEYPHLVVIGNNAPWLSMLERGRIDLVPFALSGIEEFLSRHEAAPDLLEPLIRLDALSYPLYFVMNVDSDPALVEEITRAYRRVVQNGDFERIMGFAHPGL